jgi:DNA-binding transcriptional LysR family regulator
VYVIETASFLVTLSGIQERGAVGFWVRSAAEHYQKQGLVRIVPTPIPIELPPAGLITLGRRLRTPASEQMLDCLRQSPHR